MFKKSSIFMMLLAASLVVISSTQSQLKVVVGQGPLPVQPLQKDSQILAQQSQQQQQQQQGLITQEQSKRLTQIMADAQLLDRLFPQIIKRLDGKTLATKVLPYLDITAVINPRYSQPLNYDAPADVARDLGLTGQEPARISKVKCNEGEIAVGGGFSFRGDPQDDYLSISGPSGQNEWASGAVFTEGGTIQAYVTCLTINIGLKNIQTQSQQSQPNLR
jgi:hypothetical protein